MISNIKKITSFVKIYIKSILFWGGGVYIITFVDINWAADNVICFLSKKRDLLLFNVQL